ncbi:hypothetical protein DEU56DRAFT_483656 [Suillus clintonianus]|uniref:uncharacterized protein n=1 Tax=Suillus clintonianus TaxID=1904413 RepID=UPI001B86B86A|nr:uncharacterized protein DEU56DRAFT_483656 [Suillus clintonianus]KAG2153405.1 hypothetical protein DEU56DRAFT_483656 [Suillus clintonianus]
MYHPSRKTSRMVKFSSQAKYISSISVLPDDLLLVIFQVVADDIYGVDEQLRLDCVALASVCRGWRSLVLSTSRFWMRLHMMTKFGALSREHLERNVMRSANALVDVVIYVAKPPDPWGQTGWSLVFDGAKTCLQVLRECSHRWRSLKIINEKDNHSGLFDFVLSELGLPHAPVLNEVEIICHSSGWITSLQESFQFLSTTYTPSLKMLKWEGCDSNILPGHFDASSLTHLSLNFLRQFSHTPASNSLVTFRNFLSCARNLVSLEVHRRVFLVEHAKTDGEVDPVILPALRTLSVIMGTEKPAYLSSILETIATPNLHHLAVHGDSLAWEEDGLIDFSSPAFFLGQDETPKFPSVCKLTMKNMLQSIHGPGKNMRSIFTAFPNVTEVVLDHDVREIADHLVMESYDEKAPPLWPCLQHLIIEMPPMTKFHYLPQLYEWLRLRRGCGLSLPAVVIRYGLQRAGVKEDARDLIVMRKIVNDATGYRASDTRKVVKQLGKLGALVDLRVESWTE